MDISGINIVYDETEETKNSQFMAIRVKFRLKGRFARKES